MDASEMERLRQDLKAWFPITGAMRRRKAAGRLVEQRNCPEAIPLLLEAAGSKDVQVAEAASKALADISAGPGRDVLCELAIVAPTGGAAKLCIERGYRPSEHERACLFLFVTQQLDAYFQEDWEFQNLRMQYDRADAKLRSLIMEVVRGGDRRCLPFVVRPRKKLTESTEEEIRLAIESCVRHSDWARLFGACLELPLKYGFPALVKLSGSGWEPAEPEMRSLFRQFCADVKGQELPPAREPSAASSLFEQWLARGHEGDLASASEADLLERLKSADPPDAVPIVAALATKAKAGSAAASAVAQSPHWLVRLAGHAAGLTLDLVRDKPGDDNYWINELAGAAGVLEFWPGTATPADLEALSKAPAEALAGKLGAARRVLRGIMGHRITTGVFEEMVVEAGADAAEFVQVGKSATAGKTSGGR